MVSEPFGRITYTEAIEILKEHSSKGLVTFVVDAVDSAQSFVHRRTDQLVPVVPPAS